MTENSAASTPSTLQSPKISADQIPNGSSSSVEIPMFSPQMLRAHLLKTNPAALDILPKLPATSQQQGDLMSSSPYFPMQSAFMRPGSVSRINLMQQQFGRAIAASGAFRQGMYGGQMGFGGLQQQLQLSNAMSRPGVMGQMGKFSHLSSQASAPFNIPSQILAQPSQRAAPIKDTQIHTANSSGQTMQGMQVMGLMGPLGLNSQMKSNGSLSYGQQSVTHGQFRQQLSQQIPLTSPQLIGQNLQNGSSLTAVNPRLYAQPQNGLSASAQGNISQQQWLNQMQADMTSSVSQSYYIQEQQQRQQQYFLPQFSSQPQQNSRGLSQVPQLAQQQTQLGANQQHQVQILQKQQQQQLQLQKLQQLQQLHQQQQQSSGVEGYTVSKSLTGSEPATPASSANITIELTSQRTEAGNQILGKRKLQDLVSQVDSFGKLDPEVEDFLLELADDFIDSVTEFACRLAKHRKSSILESKDLLLHLEKSWRLTIPGFSRGEQKKVLVKAVESPQMERDTTITFNQAGGNSARIE